jgi:lambda repressor-like predicted transcriptional regulator
MDIDELKGRLLAAYETQGMTLRKLAAMCDGVSHEQLRKIMTKQHANLTATKYDVIDKGLRANGF